MSDYLGEQLRDVLPVIEFGVPMATGEPSLRSVSITVNPGYQTLSTNYGACKVFSDEPRRSSVDEQGERLKHIVRERASAKPDPPVAVRLDAPSVNLAREHSFHEAARPIGRDVPPLVQGKGSASPAPVAEGGTSAYGAPRRLFPLLVRRNGTSLPHRRPFVARFGEDPETTPRPHEQRIQGHPRQARHWRDAPSRWLRP